MSDAPDKNRPGPADELLAQHMPAIVRRIRSIRGGSSDWTLRTSELLSTSARRLVASQRLRNEVVARESLFRVMDSIVRGALVDRFRRLRCQRRAIELLRHREARTDDGEADADAKREATDLLAAMSADERHLAVLRIGGAPWAHVARTLGIDEAAARQRWSALRRRLREHRPNPQTLRTPGGTSA